MELRFADGERVYNAVLRAVSSALAHKELIPQVSLEEKQEKEARQLAEKLAPRPEPFEVRRRETWNRKLPAAAAQPSTTALHPAPLCLCPPGPAQTLFCQRTDA